MGMGKEKLQVTTRIWLGYTYGSNCAIPYHPPASYMISRVCVRR